MSVTDEELLAELAAERGLTVDELVDRAVAVGADELQLMATDAEAREARSAFDAGEPIPAGADRRIARRSALVRATLEREVVEGAGPAARRTVDRLQEQSS